MNDNQLKYKNLKAEFYLSNYYTDLHTPIVIKKGQFFQNFCNDCIEVDEGTNTIELSRDGLFRLLPENMFFDEQSLSIEQEHRVSVQKRSVIQQEQRRKFEIFFIPFDTCFFRSELQIEKQVNHAETHAKQNLLRVLFDYDVDTERDPLVRQLAFFRLNASTIKGNLRILAFIVKSILQEDTRIEIEYRTLEKWLWIKQPVVVSTVLINNLSTSQYNKRMERCEGFFEKLAEWFFPFDCDYEYGIRDAEQVFILGDNLTLGYNTQL